MMANYEYIISSLPAITPGWKFVESTSFESYVGWIKSQLGVNDIRTVDFLLEGFDEGRICRDFYERALRHDSVFIRNYFTFDLNLRNAKARFLNKAFSFPEMKDTIDIPTGEFEEAAKVEEILAKTDLLQREHGLDDLVWNKVNELTTFNYFDLDSILGFIARLHIIERWSSLDEEAGRELFDRLLSEIKDTKGKKMNNIDED